MDSLSSGPGNRNNTKNLLSAVFAIAASISGSVNAATAPTPKFTDEPAESPKILDAAKAQQAILDMLPADHKSRPGIAAAIKTLEDGGSVQELTALFIWAKTIVDSPMAPPAAKEKARDIITLLTQNGKREDAGLENIENNGDINPVGIQPVQKRPTIGSKEEKELLKKEALRNEALKKVNEKLGDINAWTLDPSHPCVEVNRRSGGLSFTYKPKKSPSQLGVYYNVFNLVGGEYTVEIMDDTINLNLWLFDGNNPINQDGVPFKGAINLIVPELKPGEKRQYPVKIDIKIPDSSSKQQFNLELSPNKGNITIPKNGIRIIAKKNDNSVLVAK